MRTKTCLLTTAALVFTATPALAAPGDPIELVDGVTFDLQANARIRYEAVDQDNAVGDADAVTARLRAGIELKSGIVSFLAEGEGTLAIADDYNDTLPGNGVEPFSVVADPETFELNRLQIAIKDGGNGITIGRQRIILDDARFVGNVGWRQNEQTFDAVRGQLDVGPIDFDVTYSRSQRTIFGVDSPNEFFDGNFVFLNGGLDTANVDARLFAYLLDYDTRVAFSSQTYGGLAKFTLPLPGVNVSAEASYAAQSNYVSSPFHYNADFISAKLGAGVAGFTLTAGIEKLGADSDATCTVAGCGAFQTPMATLHAFNGWADVFLTTPFVAGSFGGLKDLYGGVSKSIAIPGFTTLNAAVVYHDFSSDFGSVDYGSEWNASLGLKVGPVGLLAKYASYDADGFSVDTDKFWLQAEYSF